MLTAEQKARLNPEQLAIAEKWEREHDARGKALDEMEAANSSKNLDAYQKAFEKFLSVGSENQGRCEHDRSIWTPCGACEEIERLLNPEFYDEDGERLPEEEIEALVLARSSIKS